MELNKLPGVLLPWYRENRRSLPWRQTREPYRIWISEIMLQQTRVEAVKGYYARFLQRLPDIESLAHCDDDELHKLWEGLGYYSRVRNLKKAAQVILTRHGGVFPTNHADVLALPGIGEYTAGAICSIAFGQKTPAVDGNVLRVISRIQADFSPIDCRSEPAAALRGFARGGNRRDADVRARSSPTLPIIEASTSSRSVSRNALSSLKDSLRR